MGFPCPRCGDRYTQSLPMVYGTGTTIRNWRSRSGYSGSTTSQSIVGSLANPPVKRSIVRPLLWLLLVWFFFGWAFALQFERLSINNPGRGPAPIVDGPKAQRHRRSAPVNPSPVLPKEQKEHSDEGLLAITLMGAGLSALFLSRFVRALRFNRSAYPQLFQSWQLSFL